MDLDQLFAISASGLDAQRTRLNIISSNLANVQSTRTTEGGPYRRQDVVFTAVPVTGTFEQTLAAQMDPTLSGVQVTRIVADPRPFRRVYEPQHPDADADGFVAYPNINPMEEMVNMMAALRSYEANVAALTAAKNMALKTLEIGQ